MLGFRVYGLRRGLGICGLGFRGLGFKFWVDKNGPEKPRDKTVGQW